MGVEEVDIGHLCACEGGEGGGGGGGVIPRVYKLLRYL